MCAQGLELDLAVLGWGTDLVREGGSWSNAKARRYQAPSKVRDPRRLRLNAYRVLLTRARDGIVIFVPPHPSLDETWSYFQSCGCRELPVDPMD